MLLLSESLTTHILTGCVCGSEPDSGHHSSIPKEHLMGRYKALPLLVVLLLSQLFSLTAVDGLYRGRGRTALESARKAARAQIAAGETARRCLFMLGRPRRVVKTEGGEVSVVSGRRWKGDSNPMHTGFVSMRPNTLFIPQYIDANLILFVQSGEVKMGWMDNDELVEENLKAGDVNVISAGSPFYIVNTDENQELQIISSMDTSENAGYGTFQSFFIGGGSYPTSVRSGFQNSTIKAALNITEEQLDRGNIGKPEQRPDHLPKRRARRPVARVCSNEAGQQRRRRVRAERARGRRLVVWSIRLLPEQKDRRRRQEAAYVRRVSYLPTYTLRSRTSRTTMDGA